MGFLMAGLNSMFGISLVSSFQLQSLVLSSGQVMIIILPFSQLIWLGDEVKCLLVGLPASWIVMVYNIHACALSLVIR